MERIKTRRTAVRIHDILDEKRKEGRKRARNHDGNAIPERLAYRATFAGKETKHETNYSAEKY
jgi:hypothetical protein